MGYSRAPGKERELTLSQYVEALAPPHLDLTLLSNSHMGDAGGPRRGTKGLTSDGRKMVRNAVWRVQRLKGRKCLSFVTLTIPRVSFEEGWYVSTNWSEIVRIFYQKLGRRLESMGAPKLWASVTEMQPERSAREGHPALHLHFVIVGRLSRYSDWLFSPSDLRELWRSVLEPYIPGERDWSRCENVQQVRKDASAYMSKYLSKGVEGGLGIRSDETGWSLPTAWYNIPLKLRQWIRENIRRDSEMMLLLEGIAAVTDTEQLTHYFYSGNIEVSKGLTVQFLIGKLRGDSMRLFIDIWKAGKG